MPAGAHWLPAGAGWGGLVEHTRPHTATAEENSLCSICGFAHRPGAAAPWSCMVLSSPAFLSSPSLTSYFDPVLSSFFFCPTYFLFYFTPSITAWPFCFFCAPSSAWQLWSDSSSGQLPGSARMAPPANAGCFSSSRFSGWYRTASPHFLHRAKEQKSYSFLAQLDWLQILKYKFEHVLGLRVWHWSCWVRVKNCKPKKPARIRQHINM